MELCQSDSMVFAFYSSDIAVYVMFFFVYSFGLFIPFHSVFVVVLCCAFNSYGTVGCCEIVLSTVSLFLLLSRVAQGREVKRRAPSVPSVGAPGPRRALRTRTPIPLWPPFCGMGK